MSPRVLQLGKFNVHGVTRLCCRERACERSTDQIIATAWERQRERDTKKNNDSNFKLRYMNFWCTMRCYSCWIYCECSHSLAVSVCIYTIYIHFNSSLRCWNGVCCMPFQPTIRVCMRPVSVFFSHSSSLTCSVQFASLKRISSELQLTTRVVLGPIPFPFSAAFYFPFHSCPTKRSTALALFLVLFWYVFLLFSGFIDSSSTTRACVYIECIAPKYIYYLV